MQILISLLMLSMVTLSKGHGRMVEPPQRSSLWRFGFEAPINNDDHSLDCGGMGVQYSPINMGKCGVCGDRHDIPQPRPNEAGGKYGRGIIARKYTAGQTFSVVLEITVDHGGWSEFRICPNNDIHKVVTEECLDKHQLKITGSGKRFYHPRVTGFLPLNVELPRGITCTQCVLQWRWKTDSSNNCNKETHENCCVGCGVQEEFLNCADVRIDPSTQTPQLNQSTGVNPLLPGEFLPITNGKQPEPKPEPEPEPELKPPQSYPKDVSKVTGFIPLGLADVKLRMSVCAATPLWQDTIGPYLANMWCHYYCDGKTCPSNLCGPNCQK